MNKELYDQLKKKYEEVKDNLRYERDPSMIQYFIKQLQEVTEEILLALAQHLLTAEEYQKETEDNNIY